jgi:nucleoside-diphosphate-sugar epimerase
VDYWHNKRVIVTGGSGFLGSVLVDKLRDAGARVFVPRSADYDLRTADGNERLHHDFHDVSALFHLAATVGGIGANMRRPADFLFDNMLMSMLVCEYARRAIVGKVVLTGSVCAYPCHCPVPFREPNLWEGYPEPTNAPYGIAKRALLTYSQALRKQYGVIGIYLIPTNLYGPCFSTDTDVMTPSGPKNIKDFATGDTVYTLNPDTEEVEIATVVGTTKTYTNEWFNLQNQHTDFRLTPDHNLYYRWEGKFKKRPVEYFRKHAGKRNGMIRFARHAPCDRYPYATHRLSLRSYLDNEHIVNGTTARDYKHSHSKPVPYEFDVSDFMEFLGWFISEGCITKDYPEHTTHGQIRICQDKTRHPEYHAQICSLLGRMGIAHGADDCAIYFASRMLKKYLKEQTGINAADKRIPVFIFAPGFPRHYRKALFDALMKGDGHANSMRYTTKSTRLKDDFIHLCFLLGYRTTSTFDGQCWRVNIQPLKNPSLKYRQITIEDADCDSAYCITVDKNHLIYAGRNGKMNWVGQCDHDDLATSHVIPALIRKIDVAKRTGAPLVVWGTGKASRDFLFVDDCADALMEAAEWYTGVDPVNLGSGEEVTIAALVTMLCDVMDYHGEVVWDNSKPDGQPRRVLDCTRAWQEFQWRATTPLRDGLERTVAAWRERNG